VQLVLITAFPFSDRLTKTTIISQNTVVFNLLIILYIVCEDIG
jgi:hypothetical protein